MDTRRKRMIERAKMRGRAISRWSGPSVADDKEGFFEGACGKCADINLVCGTCKTKGLMLSHSEAMQVAEMFNKMSRPVRRAPRRGQHR